MSLEDLYQHTGTLEYLFTTKDAQGGTINNYGSRATISCMIRAASSTEIISFASQNLQVSHVIRTGYAGTQKGDRFTDSDGNRYDIRGIWKQFGMGDIPDMFELAGWQLL